MDTPMEPYEFRMLPTSDGHDVYWEAVGNPEGTPAVYLHGGPGSGCTHGARSNFDPNAYRAVLFDLALTRRYASHTSHFEISNDFPCDTDLPTRILPGTLVDRTDNPRWAGPFAPPPLQGLPRYYEPVRQHAPRRYSTPHS